MKIALLGFDQQGRSAFNYWNTAKHSITICDQNKHLKVPVNTEAQLGKHYLQNLDQFDVLVRTPGLHPQKIVDSNPNAPDILSKVTTVTNEFLRICPTKNIIGVTGTKGKGTTSTLIAHMLKAAGKHVYLGGNIGIPPLDMVHGAGYLGSDKARPMTKSDWVVLELANFQLIDIAYSPHYAVCLMVVPEHLDWHTSLEEYLRSKQQLFVHQTEADVAIYNPHNNRSTHLATSSHGKHIPYLKKPGAYIENEAVCIDDHAVCPVSDVPLLGAHNLDNVCAAVTCVWDITQDTNAIATGIKQTTKLPYRLEQIATVDGVTFYNDSFSTTPESAKVAIQAMSGPSVIILGGSDKGASFDELARTIKDSSHVRKVLLIGTMAHTIEKALKANGYNSYEIVTGNMAHTVNTAFSKVDKPGNVLLSPACASFDMFKNYKDRGDQFNQAVQALAQVDQ